MKTKRITKEQWDLLNSEFDMEELDKAISRLKTASAKDFNGLLAGHVKVLDDVSRVNLLKIINVSGDFRNVIEGVHMCSASDLFKKGVFTDVDNYRFITLTGLFIKISVIMSVTKLTKVSQECGQ